MREKATEKVNTESNSNSPIVVTTSDSPGFKISINDDDVKVSDGSGFKININDDDVKVSEPIEAKNMGESIKVTVQEALQQILLLPFQIFIVSFSSIVVALLYMKTRQVGGESMKDLLEQFEESEHPRSNWQRRVKARLEQSGKQPSRT